MSSTQWFLTRMTAPYSPATWKGSWNLDGNVSRGLEPSKLAYPLSNGITTATRSDTSATNPYRMGVLRVVSRKLAAQTISGTVSAIFGVSESNAAADFYTKLYAYVTQGDSDLVRGVLLDHEETSAGGATEWPTTAAGIQLQGGAVALTNVNALEGDRIVIEFGVIAENSVTTSYTASIRYGTRNLSTVAALSDLTNGSLNVTTECPVITFSNAISLSATELENTTPESAEVISSYPYDESFDPLVCQLPLWFKFTPSAVTAVSSLFAGVDAASGTYEPQIAMFFTESGGAYTDEGYSSVYSQPQVFFPDDTDPIYFAIQDQNSATGATGRSLRLLARLSNTDTPVNDAILITDDSAVSADFGAGIIDPTDGSIIKMVNPFPDSENGCTNNTGNVFLSDKNDRTKAYLYDSDLVLIATVTVTGSTGADQTQCPVCTDGTDFFIAQLRNSGDVDVWQIDGATGATTDSWTGIPTDGSATRITSIAVLNNILYHISDIANTAVRKYDLVGNAPLTDFLAAPGLGVSWHDLLIVNGMVLICIVTPGVTNIVRKYTTTAVLEGTLTLNVNGPEGQPWFIDHIQKSQESSTQFWVWLHEDSLDGFIVFYYRRYNLSDFSLNTQITGRQFINGAGPTVAEGSIPDEFFGVSDSCPLIIMYPDVVPPPALRSGIYKLVPAKRNDTLWTENFAGTEDVKIPDPFAKTAYIGS